MLLSAILLLSRRGRGCWRLWEVAPGRWANKKYFFFALLTKVFTSPLIIRLLLLILNVSFLLRGFIIAVAFRGSDGNHEFLAFDYDFQNSISTFNPSNLSIYGIKSETNLKLGHAVDIGYLCLTGANIYRCRKKIFIRKELYLHSKWINNFFPLNNMSTSWTDRKKKYLMNMFFMSR